MKPEYHEGPEALERFGKTMTSLFRAPKTVTTKKEIKRKARKRRTTSEIVSKTLSQRTHCCPGCGLVLGRDHNAALNILKLGLGESHVSKQNCMQPERELCI